jgi:hypothetical protein
MARLDADLLLYPRPLYPYTLFFVPHIKEFAYPKARLLLSHRVNPNVCNSLSIGTFVLTSNNWPLAFVHGT